MPSRPAMNVAALLPPQRQPPPAMVREVLEPIPGGGVPPLERAQAAKRAPAAAATPTRPTIPLDAVVTAPAMRCATRHASSAVAVTRFGPACAVPALCEARCTCCATVVLRSRGLQAMARASTRLAVRFSRRCRMDCLGHPRRASKWRARPRSPESRASACRCVTTSAPAGPPCWWQASGPPVDGAGPARPLVKLWTGMAVLLRVDHTFSPPASGACMLSPADTHVPLVSWSSLSGDQLSVLVFCALDNVIWW